MDRKHRFIFYFGFILFAELLAIFILPFVGYVIFNDNIFFDIHFRIFLIILINIISLLPIIYIIICYEIIGKNE